MAILRPDWDEYFFRLADVAASRSSCLRRQVGAVIVRGYHVVSTGYNGTPFGFQNCDKGGCPRCAGTEPSGTGYESCLCVHAEQNAIASAARYGSGTEYGRMYLTAIEPCLSCLKSIVQAQIIDIFVGVDTIHEPLWLDDMYRTVLSCAKCNLHIVRRKRVIVGETE